MLPRRPALGLDRDHVGTVDLPEPTPGKIDHRSSPRLDPGRFVVGYAHPGTTEVTLGAAAEGQASRPKRQAYRVHAERPLLEERGHVEVVVAQVEVVVARPAAG